MKSSAVFTNISELGVAAQKNDSKLMISLVGEKGCDVNYNGTFLRYSEEYPIVAWQTPLHIASTRGNEGEKAKEDFLIKLLLVVAAVSVLLSYPETAVNPQDELGVTPLYAAASWGHSDLVETLFQAGADLELHTMLGDTPLMGSARFGYPDTVQVGPARSPSLPPSSNIEISYQEIN